MCGIETLFIDRELDKEHFYGKICRKYAPKARPRTLLSFAK